MDREKVGSGRLTTACRKRSALLDFHHDIDYIRKEIEPRRAIEAARRHEIPSDFWLRGFRDMKIGVREATAAWPLAVLIVMGLACRVTAADPHPANGVEWAEPKVIDAGPAGGPPSDAVVLFDGKDLSQWHGGDQWEIRDGFAVPKKTSISTKQEFGDCQLHIEWATPSEGQRQRPGTRQQRCLSDGKV